PTSIPRDYARLRGTAGIARARPSDTISNLAAGRHPCRHPAATPLTRRSDRVRLTNVIHAVDAHACGEPGRVIVGGVLDVPGATMFDKMCHLRDHADGLRRRMLREPRGYPAANCNLILPSSHPDADAGFVIMEQTEYPGMSGTNTICVTTVLIETGMVKAVEPITRLKLEAPAGLITVDDQVR